MCEGGWKRRTRRRNRSRKKKKRKRKSKDVRNEKKKKTRVYKMCVWKGDEEEEEEETIYKKEAVECKKRKWKRNKGRYENSYQKTSWSC